LEAAAMTQAAMSVNQNIERARKGYQAFDKGDLDTIRELLDRDVVWHVTGRSRFARDYHGIDDLFGNFFAPIISETGGTLKNEVHDILASDDHVIVLFTQRAERNGKKIEVRFAQIQHVRDGKVTESWFLTDDAYALDDFYS
jgi:ketosteroid isomerase-like protein